MLDRFERDADAILQEQIQLCEIPAPTGQEQDRADYVRAQLDRLGLSVRLDEVGNVIAHDPQLQSRPIVLSAHLDTVFGPDQPVRVARPGEPNPYRSGEIVPANEYHAPGISDAAAGLAAVLAIARTVQGTETARQLLILASVGEEGLGDLRGARHFFQSELGRSARGFITIDHSDSAVVINGGIGSRRLRVTYRGPGGHSWGHFGRYSPAFALAGAIERLAELRVPRDPRTTYNVGVVSGGETVNAIPESAAMDIDLRSESPEQLGSLAEQTQEFVAAAHRREIQRRPHGALEPTIEQIGDRPAGLTPADSELVIAARAAIAEEGLSPRLRSASTDANAAIAAGVPAIALSWGGRSDNQHSLREWFDPTDRSRALRIITRTLQQLTHGKT